jgi:hypothetical protein
VLYRGTPATIPALGIVVLDVSFAILPSGIWAWYGSGHCASDGDTAYASEEGTQNIVDRLCVTTIVL